MPIERTDSTILSVQIEDKLLSQVNNFQNSLDFQPQMKWPSSSFVDTPCTSDFHSEHYIATEEYQLFADLNFCLLYTSDAADEEDSVDLGGRRIIKKKKNRVKTERQET